MNFFPFFVNQALSTPRLSCIFQISSPITVSLSSAQKPGPIEIVDDNGTYTQILQVASNSAKNDLKQEQSFIWTPEQDQLLFEYHQQLGCKWSEIVTKIPGKTFNDVKNHFYSLLRKGLRRINGILKQYKIKYKYRAIRERFLLKLSQAMEEKFNRKLGLSQQIIQQSYSIRNWFLFMSDNTTQKVQNLQEFKTLFQQFLDFDFSFRKHKPMKSRDNGNLKKYYNKISFQTQKNKKKYPIKQPQIGQPNRVSYRVLSPSTLQVKKHVIIISTSDGIRQNKQSDQNSNLKIDTNIPLFFQQEYENRRAFIFSDSHKYGGTHTEILQSLETTL